MWNYSSFSFMIQVLHRAVDIIEYVAKNPTVPKLMGQIASDLELKTATCANIIKTLTLRGLLKKADKEKGYLLGDKLLEIANGTFGYEALLEKAILEMEKVEKLVAENSLVAILKENKRIVLQKRIASQLIQATTSDEKNAYDSSTGRLLVAMLSDNELHAYLKKYGFPTKEIWPEASGRVQFLEQVAQIRKKGYVLIEDSVQIVGIATPLYMNGKVVASFSIYMPSFRFDETVKEKIIAAALEASRAISD